MYSATRGGGERGLIGHSEWRFLRWLDLMGNRRDGIYVHVYVIMSSYKH